MDHYYYFVGWLHGVLCGLVIAVAVLALFGRIR
jgi:hypothetical protein